jgi:DNA mismatch repair protein MutH
MQPGLNEAPPAPESETALLARAEALAGASLADLACVLGKRAPELRTGHKGWSGEVIERALGVTDAHAAGPDFATLGIELKTIPVRAGGLPLESTHVCTLNIDHDAATDWPHSRVRAKLARVLFVPLIVSHGGDPAARRVGAPMLWSPNPEEERRLCSDWEEIMERVTTGGLQSVTARLGEVLQLRPKAASGASLTPGLAPDGSPEWQLPRGFYLRASFTGSLLSSNYF